MSLGPGIDPQSVYWSVHDSSFYVLDGHVNQVLHAPYSGGGAALPGLGSYSQAAVLAAPVCDITKLRAPLNGELPGVAIYDPDEPDVYLYVFRDAGGDWALESKSRPNRTPQRATVWEVADPSYVPASGPLEIFGVAGDYSVVEEVTGITLASGETANADDKHLVALPEAGLVPGLRHWVLTPGDPDGGYARGAKFLPLIRYGKATETTQARMGRGRSGEVITGDGDFVLSDVVRWQLGFETSIDVDVYLWVTFRGGTGEDPVVPLGDGVYVIDPNQIYASAGPQRVSVVDSYAAFRFPLPIPADNNLVGNTILFQFAAVAPPGGQVIVSDVFGATIRDAGVATALSSQLSAYRQSAATGRLRPSRDNLGSARRWMGESPMRLSPEQRARMRAMHETLRRQF
jgi:hypothetical protein